VVKVCCCLYSALIGLLEQSSGNQPVVMDHDHGQYIAEPLLGLGSGIHISDRAGVIAASSPGQATSTFSTQGNGIVHAIIFSRHISIYQML